jgi:hypothetical protein
MTIHRLADIPIPIRLPRRWFWLLGIVFGVFSVGVIAGAPFYSYVDFPQFWAAGRTVGTPDLLDPVRHMAWEAANGIRGDHFPYPPGTAWLFWPFAQTSIAAGFWLHAAVMTSLVGVAGVLGARTFGLDRRVGLIAAFAWAPCMASAVTGQNSVLGLVLALVTMEGLRSGRRDLAGLGVGLLLYKPQLALPLVGLLLLRRQWRSLLVAAAMAPVWYLLAVAATGGDWLWPGALVSSLNGYVAPNTAWNAVRTLSMPGVLMGWGVPALPVWTLAGAIVIAAIPVVLRRPLPEAAAGAVVVGLLVSPHALNYDGALVLPLIMWACGATAAGIAEPWRTRLLLGAYLIAPEYIFSESVGLSSLALVVVVGALIWISGWRRIGGQSSGAGEDAGEDESTRIRATDAAST